MTGPLYTIARWCLGILPVDAAGRRCFDETLADWRKEAGKATGSWAALVVSVRAMFAVLRCVAGVSLREAAMIRQSGVLTRVLLWTVGYLAALIVIRQYSVHTWEISALSQAYSQIPAAAFFLPIALLMAVSFGGRHRRLPSMGLGLAALLMGGALLGWGVPLANRAFLDANPGTATSNGQTQVLPSRPGDGLMMAMGGWRRAELYSPAIPFMNDLNVVVLGRNIAGGPESGGWNAIRWMSFFFAYLVACALIPVLAALLQRRSLPIRSAIIAITVLLLFTQGGLALPFGEFSIVWWLGAYWIPVIWMTFCLIAVTRPWAGAAQATPYVTSNSK